MSGIRQNCVLNYSCRVHWPYPLNSHSGPFSLALVCAQRLSHFMLKMSPSVKKASQFMKCSSCSNKVATQYVWHISSGFSHPLSLRPPWHEQLTERLLMTWWLPQILVIFRLFKRVKAFHLFCPLLCTSALAFLIQSITIKSFLWFHQCVSPKWSWAHGPLPSLSSPLTSVWINVGWHGLRHENRP